VQFFTKAYLRNEKIILPDIVVHSEEEMNQMLGPNRVTATQRRVL